MVLVNCCHSSAPLQCYQIFSSEPVQHFQFPSPSNLTGVAIFSWWFTSYGATSPVLPLHVAISSTPHTMLPLDQWSLYSVATFSSVVPLQCYHLRAWRCMGAVLL